MTVCIAAIAEDRKKIVMASDSKAAFGDFSADWGVTKNIPVGRNYAVMVAGNDGLYTMPTIKRLKERWKSDHLDPDEVAIMLHEELVKTRNLKTEAKILSKLGFTTESFMRDGKAQLTEAVYYDIISEIRREELSLTFLLAGFDEEGEAHLRVVTCDDCPQDFDMLGFAAIGSGASQALGSLAFAKDHTSLCQHSSLVDVTYQVLAAKFMSESATDVGKDTFYVATSKDQNCDFISSYAQGIEYIRDAWAKQGAPRDSPRALSAIADLLHSGSDEGKSLAFLARARKYANKSGKQVIDALFRQASADPDPRD